MWHVYTNIQPGRSFLKILDKHTKKETRGGNGASLATERKDCDTTQHEKTKEKTKHKNQSPYKDNVY